MAASSESHVPVAIIGAGITGMSAAHHLRQAGHRCRIFERAPQPGGLAVTSEEQGYRFDRTGHLLHLEEGQLRDLALQWIGPERLQLERLSRVWSHGVYSRYPFQANAHGLPPQVAHDCVMGFLEARRRGPPPAVEDFEQYCRAHFGDPISDHFMLPYNSRLWGVPPSQITAAWCDRFVPLPSVEEVIAGAVGLERELGYNTRFIYPRRGIGQLSDGMAADLGDVELGREVTHLDTAARELTVGGERLRYQQLISTAPLPRLIALCSDVPEAVRAAAAELRCTHLYYLDVALRRGCLVPFHWVYVPEAKYPFYRVGCYSNFSSDMAPPGCGCMYVELADRGEPKVAELLPTVAAGLVEMGMIERPEAIVFARVRRIDYAYVIFDHEHHRSLQRVRGFLDERGVISVGRYGAWTYSSMGDALACGRDAATRASERLAAAGAG